MVNHHVHHIHQRKRIHKHKEPWPNPNFWIRFLDRLLMFIAVVGPVAMVPQIYKIFIYQNASGVSALTFGLHAMFNAPWIVYGFVHKERPIYIAYMLWFLVNLVVAFGAIIYG